LWFFNFPPYGILQRTSIFFALQAHAATQPARVLPHQANYFSHESVDLQQKFSS
jgi:hypothetical protein